MRARIGRFTAVSQAVLLMATLVLPGLVAATEISTDLWVYNYGDTVTVTGVDFGANEAVELVTTDPYGAEVDRGTADTDGAGGFTYSFVLLSDVPGIYDVVATGLTSGLTAATQFDPPPPAPTNLRFVDARATGGAVTLSWTPGSGGASTECYRIYRSASSIATWSSTTTSSAVSCSGSVGGRTPFAVVTAPTATYVDAATGGSSFYYGVSGHRNGNNQGESGSSNQVSLASLDLSPSSNDFGSQGTGSTSTPQTFTITNNSNAAIAFQGVVVTGPNAGDFAVSGAPAADTSIAAAASVSFNVTFTPAGSGPRSATLEVNASSTGQSAGTFNTRLAPVTGTGVAGNTGPSVSVTGVTHGASYAYGSVPSAGCSVVDAEDGNSTFPATLSAITGPDSANGIGSQTASCSYTDGGGQSASASATYTITDGTAPTISYVVTPSSPDGSNGWYTSNVTLVWTVTESESTSTLVMTGCADQSIAADQVATIYSCSATSDGGGAGPVSVAIKRDATAPSVTVTPDRTPDANGWYTAQVTFDTSGSDLTSGVQDANCTADAIYSGPDGTGLTQLGSCTDDAGNVGNGVSDAFKYDGNAPTVTITTPLDNPDAGTGWFNIASSGTDGVLVDVATADGIGVVALACTDNGVDVGPLSATGDSFVIGDGVHAIECTATDDADNDGTDSASYSVDQTAPSLTHALSPASPDITGWYNRSTGAPTMTFTCDDATSGVASSCPEPFTFAEGTGQSHSETIYDIAGNAASTSETDIDVDLTAPSVSVALDRSPAGTGWFNIATGAPVAEFTCSDATSGIATCPDDYGFPEGENLGHSGTAYDVAGNSASASVSDIDVDLTAPSVTLTPSGTAGSNGWFRSAVTVDTAGTDGTSGVLDANCTADQSQSTSTTPAGVNFNGSCTDNAGNVGNGSPLNVKVDLVNPSVAITAPSTGTVTVLSSIIVSGSASDAHSGIDTVTVNGGSALYTEGSGTWSANVGLACGANTITAVATDVAGRATTSSSISVTRVCSSSLQFYQPIDQSTTSAVVNVAKMGRVIPVKVTGSLTLGGTPVAMTESFLNANGLTLHIDVNNANCNGSFSADAVETYADAGASNGNTSAFRWSTSQWIYNLDTGRPPAVTMTINQCYRLDVMLRDSSGFQILLSSGPAGSGPYALFKPIN